MNKRMIIEMTGQIVRLESILLLLPFIVAIIYGEQNCYIAFIAPSIISFVVGSLMVLYAKPKSKVIYAPDGFAITALAWTILSLIGALPFVISGEIKSYTDAFFETVSGFTTTGASILNNVEALSHATLFWRSFTHFIGGMGVLVLLIAILPSSTVRSIHILRAEVPGPTMGKLVPKMRSTSMLLYIIYSGLTILLFIFLVAGGMPVFDSIVHAFGTAGTGGFGIKADSIGGYSPYIQWVIAIFMVIFGVNFNVYYLILLKKFKPAIKNNELWAYLGIITVSTILITVNVSPMYNGFGESLRHSFFQVTSIISTSGFATTNFDLWPVFSKTILILLMFSGACAGSTGGGLKVSRLVLLYKLIKRSFKTMLHPRSVEVIKLDNKTVDETTLQSVSVYFALYMLCVATFLLIICIEPFDFLTNFSAVVSCFNNIGPGLSQVGPTCSFSEYSVFSKWLLSLAMLMGRLEIYPIILATQLFFSERKSKV